MKYLLVEPKLKAIANNIALLKWARWCEDKGYEYQYVRGCVEPDIIPDKILMSCIFTYYSKTYKKTIDYYLKMFPNIQIMVGGAFPTLIPKWFNQFNNLMVENVKVHKGMVDFLEGIPPKYDVVVKDETVDKKLEYRRKSKIILYSSRGCINKCGYCAVPILEGDMKSYTSIKDQLRVGKEELPDADTVVLYDNNFTAHDYFDDIVDELIEFDLPVDIHGLHVSSFTEHQAKRLAKLSWGSQGKPESTAYIRFGFDMMKYKDDVYKALKLHNKYNLKCQFFLYALYGWIDKPRDFYERVKVCKAWAEEFGHYIFLFPQRFEPLKALEKYKHIGKGWTEVELAGIRRMATFLHGFIQCSHTNNTWDWIGWTEREFWHNVEELGKSNKYRLIKTRG